MQSWRAYKENGILPFAGGWLDQPLDVLAQITAVDLVVDTLQNAMKPEFNYNLFNATQRELIAWLEKR